MKNAGSRASLIRLAICICAVVAAAVAERYVPEIRIGGDAAEVFAAIGKIPAEEHTDGDMRDEVHPVLSIPEIPQTTVFADEDSSEPAVTVTIAYAAD